ncbi:MAG: hypothetical protein HN348_16135 [Proteobacteria bacterium]|nr:hypothetical protein [Pseudomonadota bacterium]
MTTTQSEFLTIYQRLAALGLLGKGRVITIEDWVRQARWVPFLEELAEEGMEPVVEVAGDSIVISAGDAVFHWEFCRGSCDVYIGYDRITSPSLSQSWALPRFVRPTGESAELLNRASSAIAYCGGGSSHQLVHEALGLRPLVKSGDLSQHLVVFRLPFAAEGWTVVSKTVAKAQVGTWRVISAEDDDDANEHASNLRFL